MRYLFCYAANMPALTRIHGVAVSGAIDNDKTADEQTLIATQEETGFLETLF